MSLKNILAGSALGLGLLGGGALIANAATTASTSNTTTSASSATSSENSHTQGGDRGANPNDKTITGADADKATAAVTAKYSSFQVSLVQQDPDGSYDVHGTQDGQSIMYNVTSDFQVSSDNSLGMTHGSDAGQSNASASSDSSSS